MQSSTIVYPVQDFSGNGTSNDISQNGWLGGYGARSLIVDSVGGFTGSLQVLAFGKFPCTLQKSDGTFTDTVTTTGAWTILTPAPFYTIQASGWSAGTATVYIAGFTVG